MWLRRPAGAVANLMVASWTSSSQAKLFKVSRLDVDLSGHGNLVLQVIFGNLLLLLEGSLSLAQHLKVSRCDSDLRQLIPVELVGLRHPHERAGVLDLASVLDHVLARPLLDAYKGACMKSSSIARR